MKWWLCIVVLLCSTLRFESQTIIAGGARKPLAAAGGGGAPTLSSASTVDVDTNSDDPETFTHTISTLSSGYIVVKVATRSANLPSTVTFDGTSMTKLAEETHATEAHTVQLWGVAVANKAAGTYTISCDRPGSGSLFVGISEAWNGVHQTTSTGTAVTAEGSAGTATVDVSSASNEIVVDVVCNALNASLTVGAGQTTTFNVTNGAGGSYETGAATTTMSWTVPNQWVIAAVGLKPQ